MNTILSVAVGVLLAIPSEAVAHQLDEYLQAARLGIAGGRVTLELDLSPGIRVAPGVLSLIDRDADRRIAALEAEAYARHVLRDLVLEVDGQAATLTLTRSETSAFGEITDGIGTIRLEAFATVRQGAGRHRLFFRNNHLAGIGAYLVNALKPSTGDVGISAQRRDERQREIVVEYELTRANPSTRLLLTWLRASQRLLFLLFGGGVLAALVVFRKQSTPGRPKAAGRDRERHSLPRTSAGSPAPSTTPSWIMRTRSAIWRSSVAS